MKIKIVFIIVVLSLPIVNLISQEFQIQGEMYTGYMDFYSNDLLYYDFNGGNPIELQADYSIEMTGKLRKLIIKEPISKSFIFLKSDPFSILINSNNQAELYGPNPSYRNLPYSIFGIFEGFYLSCSYREITATSYLTEGDIEFLPQNLTSLNAAKPWVEGVPGNGIGEKITISGFNANRRPHTIIISIGYVDYDKPYLYDYNSRPSKIRIWRNGNGKYINFELADTPDPQILNLPEGLDLFTIEILDVYPGSRWEDTCINFIMVASGMENYFW